MKKSDNFADKHRRIKVSNQVWYWAQMPDNCYSCHSLSQYVEANSHSLRKKYLIFIHSLGQKSINKSRIVEHFEVTHGFSLWWMTTLSEKSPLKSPVIQDCLKLFALSEILKKKSPSVISLHDIDDKRIKKSILIICRNLSIKVKTYSKNNNIFFPIFKFKGWIFKNIPHIIKGISWAIRYLFHHWRLRGVSSISLFSGNKTVFFFSYFINIDSEKASKSEFYSHQWGALPHLFHKLGYRSNWMHHFLFSNQIPNTEIGIEMVENFNANSKKFSKHSFLDGYISPSIILRATLIWLRLILISLKLYKVNKLFVDEESVVSLWPLLKYDWYKSIRGSTAFQNVLWVELMNSAFTKLPKQNIGLYLYEGQGWERAFIYFWKKHNHGELTAVVHSVIRFWDLRYFNYSASIKDKSYLSMPIPDKIAVNGPSAMKLIEKYHSTDNIIKTEAVRYLNFEKFSERGDAVYSNSKNRNLLVLGGGMPSNSTQELLGVLESESGYINDNFTVVVKPHPDYFIEQSEYPKLNFKLVTNPLYEILHKFDIVIGVHQSSAHLDTHLAGLPVIVYLPDGDLNLSPLRGVYGVHVVNNGETLVKALEVSCSNIKRNYSQFFWLDKNLSKWRKAIKSGF